MTYGGTPDAYLGQLATSTPAQVKAAADKWLRANYYTMTVKPFARLAAARPAVDRKVLPALGNPPDVEFPAIARAQLKNGLKVLLLERHSAPIVNVALVGRCRRRVRCAGQVTWLVIGDLRKIEKGVRELGWGEVLVLDAEGNPLPR
jgi:hypothetical protein